MLTRRQALAALGAGIYAFGRARAEAGAEQPPPMVIDGLGEIHIDYPPALLDEILAAGMRGCVITLGNPALQGFTARQSVAAELAAYDAHVRANPERLMKALRVADLDTAAAQRRIGLVYYLQNSTPLGDDLASLHDLHADGIRIIQLTYNSRNLVGDGCMERTNSGLSRFGLDLVAAVNEKRILVDLSHCGEATTREGIAFSKAPVAITHAGCSAVFDHPRNKGDHLLRALADKGGVIGIFQINPYLGAKERNTLDDYLAHVDHAVKIVGEDHVAVGSDREHRTIPDTPEEKQKLIDELARLRPTSAASFRWPFFVAELNHPRRWRRSQPRSRVAATRHARSTRFSAATGTACSTTPSAECTIMRTNASAITIAVLLGSALLGHPAGTTAARPVSFSVSEGTWMSVDVSPDGRTLVFDLLGDLYTLPIEGGRARRLTDGRAYDTQPGWAPDGSAIVFTSDRSGSDNLWLVAADGSGARAVTTERDGGLTAPSWSPDSRYIVVRKDPTLNRRGSSELWLYHRDGGRGVQLTTRTVQPGFNPNGPVFSRDGRWVYFAHGNRVLDFTWVPWQIWRLDRQSGDVSQVTTGYRGAVRPTVSSDGRHLAFIRRDHAQSALVLRDLDTGAERDLRTGLDRDDQRGTTDYDAYPGFSFTPDGKSIVLATGGKIQRIAVDGSGASNIPFTADVAFDLPERPVVRHRVTDDPITARVIRWPQFTPRNELVFETLGKLWIRRGDGLVQRLTSDRHREYAPALSPDGRWLAYVSWDDATGGRLWKIPLGDAGNRRPTMLTRVARQYANPAWSPDGSKIVLSWRPPNVGSTANVWEDDAWHAIVWVPAEGGETQIVTMVRPRTTGRWYPVPRFSSDGSRIFFLTASSATRNDLVSVGLDGTAHRAHARFPYVEEADVSPDGRQLAFISMEDVYLADLPGLGDTPLEIDLVRPSMPLRRIADAGAYLTWAADGRTLTWSHGDTVYRTPVDPSRSVGVGDTATAEAIQVRVTAPRALPTTTMLLRGARLITMRGDEIIERGDLLVRGVRIAAVGPSGSLTVPGDAQVVDAAGKTIIPGLVDAHWHGHYQGQEIFPQHKWQYLADLAYGLTTAREVSAPTRDTVAQADLIETGEAVGPRVFGTGWPLFSGREGGASQVVLIENLEDARRHVRRLKRSGVTWVKQYLQPRREQRQWLQQAALEERLMITAEGGGLKVQTTMVLDGYTNFEHGIPVAPLYQDMIQLLARSKTAVTPTFVAGYAKPGSMDYYYATRDVHEDPRARRFMPHDLLDRFTAIRILIPDDQYFYRTAARSAYDLYKAGGLLAVGGHGNHPGVGMHWELWSFVDGGMPPLDALRLATLGGAELLGIAQDLGSLEAGKIADLVVLNADPRDDIKKTTDVFRVMKAGRLYDPEALATMIPGGFAGPRVTSPAPERNR